jgi:hypothetical protein
MNGKLSHSVDISPVFYVPKIIPLLSSMNRAQRSINHLLKINKNDHKKITTPFPIFYFSIVVPETKPNINKEEKRNYNKDHHNLLAKCGVV